MYTVYIQTNPSGLLTAINSDAFLTDLTNWTQIDEGEGDRYMHSQGNYLPKPLMTEMGIYRYKLVKGKVTERTAAEVAADVAKTPKPGPTDAERISALMAEVAALKNSVATNAEKILSIESKSAPGLTPGKTL